MTTQMWKIRTSMRPDDVRVVDAAEVAALRGLGVLLSAEPKWPDLEPVVERRLGAQQREASRRAARVASGQSRATPPAR